MTLALDRLRDPSAGDGLPAAVAGEAPLSELPEVVGVRLRVPLVTGGDAPYANLDHAASAPCLRAVRDAVDELLPYYASVHRGAGWASQVCTAVYERARDAVRRFVGAHPRDAVVFTRNTTDALNLLARTVPRDTSVVLFDTDHHAALLPWRGPWVRRLATPATPHAAVRALEAGLREAPVGPRLVVITGASNVTGELWPVEELAEVAARHGARTVLDAAQLAPHRPVDAYRRGVDYVAISGHKLYAPFGAGALVGRPDWLQAAQPYLAGGGASKRVVDWGDHLGVSWAAVPERHEAGSPNVVGAHALAAACTALAGCQAAVAAHEEALLLRLRAGLATVPGLRELALFGADHPRVGVVSFAVDGWEPGLLAAALSAEHGIGLRDGAFCAHLATRRLLDSAGASTSGTALRASLGLGSTAEHVDRLVAALRTLVTDGPGWRYVQVDGRWAPEPDPRPRPPLLDTAAAVDG
jgi:selenocysteine lyase/cysteine desulfurase